MNYINIYDMKTKFSAYARKVMQGREFIIAYRNRPFAVFKPLESVVKRKKVTFGALKGKFPIPVGFDEPLEDFEKDFYGN